jgi:NAD(P)-dependent dehydrogenase (short-subunit alcohol dehydrogenase family)
MSGYIQFLRGQFSTPPVPKVDLTDRTILVTGANSGLGYDAAKLLIELRCSTVVIATRDSAKGQKTKNLLEEYGKSIARRPTIIAFELELASFKSVVSFSERCKDLPRLDAVILNAGVDRTEFQLLEGYESTITINVISTFFLATLLIPTLRLTAQKYKVTPNIAITGSAVHFWVKNYKVLTMLPKGMILESLSDAKTADMSVQRYHLSKLIVMLLVKYLATRLAQGQPSVVMNNVAPGYCVTNLFREASSIGVTASLKILGRPSEHGARTLVHGAVAGTETNGQYLSECVVKNASAFVKSEEGDRTAEKIWGELSAIYETIKPGCTKEL